MRVGTGWQMIIADLSMILFMLTASAVARQDNKPAAAVLAPAPAPAPSGAESLAAGPSAEPVAVWIAGKGAPPLRTWLAEQPRDPRQQVTITASYAPGAMGEALAKAQALAQEAGNARIVVEPGPPGIRVVLSYDAPAAWLAHSLQVSAGNPSAKDHP